MDYLLIEYPKCSTCKKAKSFLNDHKVSFASRHIVTETPTVEELSKWIKESGYPLKTFFNTSGNVYKALNLKDRLSSMSVEEQIQLLASNGMLIHRPLLIGKQTVLVGFRVREWEEIILK